MPIATAPSPRRAIAVWLVAIAALLGALAPAAAGQERETGGASSASVNAAPDRLIVHGARPSGDATRLGPDSWLVEVDPEERDATRRRLATQPGVDRVELDTAYRVATDPNDPCYEGCFVTGSATTRDQWYLRKVRAPVAWDVTQGSESVLVAVLDTGVFANHEDLVGKVITRPGCGTAGATTDPHGHGTSVAGIIGANTGNTLGIAGLGWKTRILAVRVLDSDGVGFAATISRGIRCAVDNGARIINLSLTGQFNEEVAKAVEYAQSQGAVVLAASGNEASPEESYPGALPGVIAVASTTTSDTIAGYSNVGPWVDIAAPGSGILVTLPGTAADPEGTYGLQTGTSFSVAQVSGALALLLAKEPGLSLDAAATRLKRTAARIPGSGSSIESGRLDVGAGVTAARAGYWMATAAGEVFGFGDSPTLGSVAGGVRAPVVAMASTPTAGGYWLAGSDGGVFRFGDAPFHGSAGHLRLNRPIVGMASTPTGNGYWLVASDGGIFSFGDARFFGSTGNIRLNQPIVGMAPTPTGKGYWLVASDGGIFSFGDARFFGSTGNIRLNRPVVGMSPTASGRGYWLVATDGGIFAFGDARFFGSTGNIRLNQPIRDMVATLGGRGYWLVASDGGIFSFGDAPFFGSAAGRSRSPVVSASGA